MHELTQFAFELPDIEEWLAGDSRTLAFTVVDADGNAVDVSGATFSWALFDRDYQTDAADAVIDGSSSGVEIVTDNRVDTTAGQWEVRLDPGATESLWGEYYQRPEIEQTDGSTASWRGDVILTA